MNQNLISNISISDADGQNALVLQGTIRSLSQADITINKVEGANRFSLTLNNSLWDSSEPATKSFPGNDWVDRISIVNDMRAGTGREPVFSVSFNVETRQDVTPTVDSPIATTELKIMLGGGSLQAKTPQTKTPMSIAEEREEAIRHQESIKQEAQQAQVRAEESVDAVLQQIKKPTNLQVAIFNASGYPKRAYNLSVYLGKLKKEYIEESLGMRMEIVNISNAKDMDHQQSTIRFRDNYLKAALFLAQLIKGNQRVIPIGESEEKQDVHIEIYLGRDYK